MKKVCIALIIILLISFFGINAASAASVSISGNSTVYAGRTYTYKVTIKAYGSSCEGSITCSGIFSGNRVTFWEDSGSGGNESLTIKTSIKVKVNSGANIGDTGKLKVSGSYSQFDSKTGKVTEHSLSKSLTIKVGKPSASSPSSKPKPKSSGKPKPTPAETPLPSPSGTIEIIETSPPLDMPDWEDISEKVGLMNAGDTIKVDMLNAKSIPASLFGALKLSGGAIEFDFGDYKCAVEGRDLGEIPYFPAELNLGLEMRKDEELSRACGGMDIYQLHFSHEGQLPGVFAFTIKALGLSPGDKVYLYYYYDKSGVMEGKQLLTVDENGYITVEICHCSGYLITKDIIEGAVDNFVKPAPAAVKNADIMEISVLTFALSLIIVAAVSAFAVLIFKKPGIFSKKPEVREETPDNIDIPEN